MNRRALIAGATLAPLSLSGCLEGDDGPIGDENDAETDAERDDSAVEVTAIDAPGSDAGTVGVPAEDQVLLVNCIRITCPTSRAMLPRVGEARYRLTEARDVGPDGDVHVLTVVDEHTGAEPTPEELADWWADQDGDWTLAVDEGGDLFERYEVDGTPTTLAIDGGGEVHWRDEGGTTESNLVSGVETALEAADS